MDLKYWKQKIKQSRKDTDFKEFIKEILSWTPVIFNKNNGLISRWPDTSRVNVCSLKEFEENRDDLTKTGIDYNFNNDFFKNFQKLFQSIKLPNLIHYGENSNCDYSEAVLCSKNAYLSNIVIRDCENIFYSFLIRSKNTDIYNSLYVQNGSSYIYFSRGILNSFKVFYSSFINNSNNIRFSSNLTGCSECIFCNNLDNCSYYIKNKKYDKQEYLKQKKLILENKNNFLNYYKKVDKFGINHSSTNVDGNFIIQSENIKNGNYVNNMKNARNVIFTGSHEGNEDFYDVCPGGGGGGNSFYAVNGAGDGSDNLYCSYGIGSSTNIFHCFYLESCSYCIGCVGLRNKSYCIFNKQYTKDEWIKLANRIFAQMEKDGILGNFFPGELNPLYFNDTLAGLLGNFEKNEVKKKGFMWRNEVIKIDIPDGAQTIKTSELSEYQGYNEFGKWKINSGILNKIIIDEKGNYYKIVKEEYDFLNKHSLPIPEIHWKDRMKMNLGV